MSFFIFLITFSVSYLTQCNASLFGPPYPITGSWFKDRYTRTDWNATLRDFAKQGGDTVLLRAPALVVVNPEYFSQDPNFKVRIYQ